MSAKLSILLCDDHQIVRMGLKTLIELREDLVVIGEARNGDEAVHLARRLKPDVIVMDLMMPKKNGVEATREILAENPAARILVLTTFGASEDTARVLEAGALGALVKDTSHHTLLKAIRKTAMGERVVGEGITTTIGTSTPRLTERQRSVLLLASRGMTSKQIAEHLNLSEDGVNFHFRTIFAKLGVASRSEAIAMAITSLGLNASSHPPTRC